MRPHRILLAISLLLIILSSGCSDDSTSPSVVVSVTSVSPAANAVGVPVDQTITVVFNVDMDPATAAANLTVAPGGVTALNWTDARTLTITHPVWTEGSVITVTVGTGFATAAGETLPAPLTFSFTVLSDVPQVVQVYPSANDSGVDVDEQVRIVFSEAMDPATATGNVTLSSGAVSGLSWFDARTLLIDHADWGNGELVTVTAGTGLTDLSGTGLAAPFAWSFRTWTNDVILESSLPADGAVDVATNPQIQLRFSHGMNRTTLINALSVTSPDKYNHSFIVDGEGEDWSLALGAPLPANTVITVTITTAAQAQDGTPLAAETSFSFTTGTDIDTTPPELVSVAPVDGATIPAGTSFLQLTFSEPVDEQSMNVSRMSGQLARYFMREGAEPIWSENYTVVTVALPVPLPAGAPLRLEFESFADLNGNVNTDGFDWAAVVEGVADHYPLEDGMAFMYYGTGSESGGKDNPYFIDQILLEEQLNGDFHRKSYDDWSGTFTDWDILRRDGDELLLRGFQDNDGSPEKSETLFSPPVVWLRYPMTTQSWNGSSTMGETGAVDYTITVLPGLFQVVAPTTLDKQEGPSDEIYWADCRKVVLHYEVSEATDPVSAGTDTIWYAPAVGIVREITHEEGTDGYTSDSDKTLFWVGFATEGR